MLRRTQRLIARLPILSPTRPHPLRLQLLGELIGMKRRGRRIVVHHAIRLEPRVREAVDDGRAGQEHGEQTCVPRERHGSLAHARLTLSVRRVVVGLLVDGGVLRLRDGAVEPGILLRLLRHELCERERATGA